MLKQRHFKALLFFVVLILIIKSVTFLSLDEFKLNCQENITMEQVFSCGRTNPINSQAIIEKVKSIDSESIVELKFFSSVGLCLFLLSALMRYVVLRSLCTILKSSMLQINTVFFNCGKYKNIPFFYHSI